MDELLTKIVEDVKEVAGELGSPTFSASDVNMVYNLYLGQKMTAEVRQREDEIIQKQLDALSAQRGPSPLPYVSKELLN